MPIKDCINHYHRALFNDIPRVGTYFQDIPGSGRSLTTYPDRDALLRHTRVGAQFNDIPGSRDLYKLISICLGKTYFNRFITPKILDNLLVTIFPCSFHDKCSYSKTHRNENCDTISIVLLFMDHVCSVLRRL